MGYTYGTTTIDGFEGMMTWNGSESTEAIGADQSISLDELI